MRKSSVVLSAFALILFQFLIACGGGTKPVAVSITSSSSSTTMPAGSSAVTLTATVSNDTKNGGNTWAALSPATGCGTLTTSATTATYTPPSAATLNADCTATITAISASDTTKTAALVLTVKAITVTVAAGSTVTFGAGAPAVTLTGTLNNEATGAGDTVAWSLTSSGGLAPGISRASRATNVISSNCGTLAPTGATAVYTPPAATLASSCTATITAASTINSNSTKAITFTTNPITVTVTPPASTTVVEGGTSGALSAAMSNNGSSDATLNWTVTPAGCGTVSSAHGSSVTYTAPTPIPQACSNAATVTAASDANPGATAAANFTITPITVSITAPTSAPTLVEGATQVITATTNDLAGASALKWTVSPGCGTLSASTGSSSTFNAPTSIAAACTPTVTVTSATDSTKTATLNITVNPITVSITSPTGSQTMLSGASPLAITASTNDLAGASNLNWSLSPSTSCGSLLATTGASVSYTPPLMLASQCSATATVSSKTDSSKTATLAITVNPAPIVVTLTSPVSGTASLLEGATQAVTATIYNDATASGIGYSLNPNSCGSFSGMTKQSTSGATSTYTGTYTSPLSVCNTNLVLSSNQDPSKTATLAITVTPIAVNITSPTGSQTMLSGSSPLAINASTNDPAGATNLNWSLATTCPSGSLSATTGAGVSYTPPLMLVSQCSATVTVASKTDSTKTATVAITVNPAPIVVTLTSSANPSVGFGGTLTITATIYNDAQNAGIESGFNPGYGSCGTFSLMSKQSTSGATSTYAGTYTAPQTACTQAIMFASPEGSNTVTVTITVLPGISVALSPAGPLTIDANGPLSITPTVTADIAGKGVNLTLNPPTGCGSVPATANSLAAFTYTPPSSLSNSCTVSVIATSQSDPGKSATLALTVYPALTLPAANPNPTSLGSATQGAQYTGYLNANGGTGNGFGWVVTNLSNGLTSNAAGNNGSTLTITGPPTSATSVTFTATVSDSTGTSVSQTYTIPVNAYVAVTLPSTGLPNATVGQSNYNAGINAVGGVQTYTFTVNGTPIPTNNTPTAIGTTGLIATSSGGNSLILSGAPAGAANTQINLSVGVVDGEGHSANANYTINVNAAGPPLSVDPTQYGSIPRGVVGQTYQLNMNAQGGTQPYTAFTTVSAGTPPTGATAGLPPGLVYSPANNTLWGTPTAAGTYYFAATVTDSNNTTSQPSPAVTIIIGAAPSNTRNVWLNGRYVCLMKGYMDGGGGTNGTSPVAFSSLSSLSSSGNGSFSGIFDMVQNGGSNQGILNTGTVSSSVNIGSDNHGIMNIIASMNGSVVNTSTLAVVLNQVSGTVATEFHGVEIDDVGPNPSGQHGEITCYQATTPFASGNVSGKGFAMGLAGVDGSGMGKNMLGVYTLGSISNNSGTITAGESDVLKADGSTGNTTSVTGTYTLPSTFSTDGRYVVSITGSKPQTLINYMIDAKRGLMLEVQGTGITTGEVMSGNVRTQQQKSYSNANLNGPFVMYYHSTEFGGTPPVILDYNASLIQGTGDATSGATMNVIYQDQANVTLDVTGSGTLSSTVNQTIPLTVTSNGRAVFTDSTSHKSMNFYMFDNNSAFVMDGTEGLGVGWMDAQNLPDGTIMGSSTGTTYMMFDMPVSSPDWDSNQGMLTITGDSAGTINGVNDSAGKGWFSWDEPMNDQGGTITYAGPATVGTVTGVITIAAGDKSPNCIAVTSVKFVCISPDNTPNIQIMIQ